VPTDRRPLALGYIRRHPLMTDTELGGMRTRLSSFAEANGLRLGKTFVETKETAPTQFTAMVWEASMLSAVGVLAVVEHLEPLGGVKAHLEHYTRARLVLVKAEEELTPQTGEVGARGF
jgi:hypothetical protein